MNYSSANLMNANEFSNKSFMPIKKQCIVLVVDDEPFIQLAVSNILIKLGCNVDKASNGKMSVDMVKEKFENGDQYDMIFMDVNMPIMSGYEAAQNIKKLKGLTTPIICVSAQDSIQHKEKCESSGMIDIISKPCTLKKIKEIMQKYNLLS